MIQVNSAWAAGDFGGARDSSKMAKTWSLVAIVSHVITIVTTVVVIIVIIVIGVANAAVVSSSIDTNYYYN